MAESRRTTVYFDPALHRALRLRAAATDRPLSEIVNDAVRRAFAEDAADLEVARKRRREVPESFEAAVKAMRRRGEL